jgi:hypothetical protein
VKKIKTCVLVGLFTSNFGENLLDLEIVFW